MPGLSAKERAQAALERYLDRDDEEALLDYERNLQSALELAELDWDICFKCGYQVVVNQKLNGRGQWFGAWGRYSMAMLCSHCAPNTPTIAPMVVVGK